MLAGIPPGSLHCSTACVFVFFYVLLTVRLCIILQIKPTWCTIYSQYIYQSLHVSGDYGPIIKRNNSVYATFGGCYSVWVTVWYVGWNEFHPSTLHTRQSSTQNKKYQVSHKPSCFSWWWAHSRPKHVEIDKYTKNKLCTKLVLFTRLMFVCPRSLPLVLLWFSVRVNKAQPRLFQNCTNNFKWDFEMSKLVVSNKPCW
jgi:hypothetical protein